MLSFHFANPVAGVLSRLNAPEPFHASYGRLAELHKAYEGCPLHQAALRAMVNFGDPHVLAAPKNFIFTETEGGIVTHEPYNDFRDGARIVLARARAHLESANRKNKAYKPPNELVPDSLLDEYAVSGRVPANAPLVGAPLVPSPPRVVINLGDAQQLPQFTRWADVLEQTLQAHREYRIEIKRIELRGDTAQTRNFYGKHNKKRGKMELFKAPGDDPGGAIGVLELMLRKRKLLEENMISITKMDYETQTRAWKANKTQIMRENKIKSTKWLAWRKKKELLEEFQDAHDGISLKPKIISKSRKRKSAKLEKKKLQCCPERQGAATASFGALQQPQIVWHNWLAPTPRAAYWGAQPNVLVITAHALNRLPVDVNLSFFDAVIVLKSDNTKIRCDGDLPPKTLVLTSELEMKHLDMLVQWLPLVTPKPVQREHFDPRTLSNLQAWCDERVRLLKKHLKNNQDFMEEDEATAVQALLRQTRCLPQFAAACGMNDIPAVPALEKLTATDATNRDYFDVEQSRKLSETHNKVEWMVTSHMKH